MVRHSSILRAVFIFLAVFLALCVMGCSLLPGPVTPRHTQGRTLRSPPTQGVTSRYEHTPSLEWRRHAVGQPHSLGSALFTRLGAPACDPVPMGFARVLPVTEGVSVGTVKRMGPLGFGLAGLPSAGGLPAPPTPEAMLETTSRMASTGQACRPSLFAFVRFGMGPAYAPVTVLR